MPKRYWRATLSLWPGLAQIWSGQEALGLMLAGFFAVALNAAIVTRFVWTEALPASGPAFAATVAGTTWASALGYSLWWLWRCHPDGYRGEIDRLYREALELYLQGRWDEARRLLESLLTRDEADSDALMQLGTIYSRAGQDSLAIRTFRQCLDTEGGTKWRWEIDRALAKLCAR